jgi:glycosyltransferase involved in cell wall biosynthesis
MRIMHVMASRADGGAETYSADVIESLHAAGIAQLAAVPSASRHHARLLAAGVALAEGALEVPIGAWRRRKLAEAMDGFRPDLVHCWMRRAASLVPPVTVPRVGWFGGYYDPARFRGCRHFIAVTPAIVDHLLAHGIARACAHYVPTFPTLEAAPPVDRARLATSTDAIVLLALSRLHDKKGLDVLLQALAQLPRCVAWLAGDGPLKGQLCALADKLGVAERVRWLGWRTDRGALLRAADVCVLPSRFEPFGTVMLEAWAAATPLVAAASQGPAALIRDGDNGLLVPVDDADALAAAIRRLADDAALRARLIAAGMADYQRGFTREVVTRRLIALYQAIIFEAGALRIANGAQEHAHE